MMSHSDQRLKVIQTVRSPIAPRSGLILPFSLVFSQMVALMLPHRSWFAGLLLRGACPILTVLLRRTICDHLRRARPEKILNGFQRIHLRFFQACGLASGHTSFASSRRANVGQAPCHLVSSLVEMKLALSRGGESQRTVHGGNASQDYS
jgi:hypothetical protein